MGNFVKEFKEFAVKGNVIDMAVGVIIGGAFGKIVSSLVNDIIMPGIGVLTGGLNFSEHKFVLKQAVMKGTEVITPEVAITWGAFVQTIVDFLIVALCIFVAIKAINQLKKAKEEEPAPEAPAGPTQEELLTDIKQLLQRQVELEEKGKIAAPAPADVAAADVKKAE